MVVPQGELQTGNNEERYEFGWRSDPPFIPVVAQINREHGGTIC